VSEREYVQIERGLVETRTVAIHVRVSDESETARYAADELGRKDQYALKGDIQ
jgi:hypothetical protein